MKKKYQRQIIELADKIIDSLVESDFYKDEEIDDYEPGRVIICDFLTQKFINGELNDGMVNMSETELGKVLSLIIASSAISSLTEKGLINSFEDETGEELFFLTAKGKKLSK